VALSPAGTAFHNLGRVEAQVTPGPLSVRSVCESFPSYGYRLPVAHVVILMTALM